MHISSTKIDKKIIEPHYIQPNLIHLDTLIHRQIQRMQRLRAQGGSPQNVFDAISFSVEQAFELLEYPFGKLPDEPKDTNPSEADHEQKLASLSQQNATEAAAANARGDVLPLEHIVDAFGLVPFERHVLLICLAPELDLRYEKLYGFLLDDLTRKRPTVNLILDLLCEAGPERLAPLAHFDADAPLFKHRLLARVTEPGIHQPPLLNQAFAPGAGIVAALLGEVQLHPDIRAYATLTKKPEADQALLTADLQNAITQLVDSEAIATFSGRDSLIQQAAAQLLASTHQRPLLALDLAAATKAGVNPQEIVQLALRDARLANAVAQIAGWDHILEESAPPQTLFTAVKRASWPCGVDRRTVLAAASRWI